MQSHRDIARAGEGEAKQKPSHKAVEETYQTSGPRYAVSWKELREKRKLRADVMAALRQKDNCRCTDCAAQECSHAGAERHSIKFRKCLGKDFLRRRTCEAE